MKTFFKFTTIVILLIMLIGLVLVFFVSNSFYEGKGTSIKFINYSGQPIVSANILVAGQACSVKHLGVNGELQCYFENLYDSHYAVSVTLQSGSGFTEESLGYVTSGVDYYDTISINSFGKIVLESATSMDSTK